MELREENILDILDKAGLTEENASISKKIYQMRTVIICKYINCMSREETCYYMYAEKPDYGYITLSTYHRILSKALDRIKKVI